MSCNLTRAFTTGERVERATEALPSSARDALFTVSGGRVLVTLLLGVVTSSVSASGTSFYLYCYSGATQRNQISAQLSLHGTPAGDLIGPSGPGYAISGQPINGVDVLPSGASIELSSDGSATGSVAWTLTYVPLDDGASVVAA